MRKMFAQFFRTLLPAAFTDKTSTLPPALAIFSCADLENLCACHRESQPSTRRLARIFTGCFGLNHPGFAAAFDFGSNGLAMKFLRPISSKPLQDSRMLNSFAENVVSRAIGMRGAAASARLRSRESCAKPVRDAALCPTSRSLAHAGAHATAHTLALFLSLLRCLEYWIKIHN